MTYTMILNLLACELDYTKLSDHEIFGELEVLDENLDEFLDRDNIPNNLKSEFEKLYFEIKKFLSKGNNIQRVKSNADNWRIVKEKAFFLLNALNIEIVSPEEFLERYDWEDEDEWDGKIGTVG